MDGESSRMLLCDIGNTSYHFYDLQNDYKKDVACFDPSSVKEDVYYICVHPTLKKRLRSLSNWHDLEERIDRTNYYDTMGVDRIVACEAVQNGVIVDAGSAVTVDVVRDGIFAGGFIYPGIRAFQGAYASISKNLDLELRFDTDLRKLPKSTHDALAYGFLSPLLKEIDSYDMDIFITGGDAKIIQKYLPHAKRDDLLLFRGMLLLVGKQL